jgi:hypothetical protein
MLVRVVGQQSECASPGWGVRTGTESRRKRARSEVIDLMKKEIEAI